MCWLTSLVSVIVFVLCSPNILARLPKKGNKYLVALVHGIIFTILLTLLNGYLPVIEGASTSISGNNSAARSGGNRGPMNGCCIAWIVVAGIIVGVPLLALIGLLLSNFV
jgi:hypothetical protein